MSTFITKKSSVYGKVPISADLVHGELAVNTADKKLYSKHSDGSIVELSPLTINTATLSLFPARFKTAVVSVSVAGITSTSLVMCQLQSNIDFDVDDLAEYIVNASTSTDMITFTISSDSPICGDFTVKYIKVN